MLSANIPTFVFGSAMSIVMVLIYTHLGHVSLTTAIMVNVLMFVGIFSRMIPSQALISAIPDASQRGSFSAVSASLQQLSGGLGSVLAARDHRAKCRRFAPAFRLAGLHRGCDVAGLAHVMYFRAEVGREAGGQAVGLRTAVRRCRGPIAKPGDGRWSPRDGCAFVRRIGANKWCPGKDSNLHGR